MGSTEPLSLAPVASEIEPVSDVTYAAMSMRTPPPSHEHTARRTRMHDAFSTLSDCRAPTHSGRQTNPYPNLTPWARLTITLALASLTTRPRPTCTAPALTCILTGLTLSACPLPCAPPPARQSLPGSKRHQPARQGINLTSTSPPRSSLHHRMFIIEALLKEAERAAASSNSSSEQQQQQQRAAATAANSSNNSEQQQRAAGASSSEQQQHRAASNSSREQQQQQRSAAVIAAAVANSTYPPIHLYVHISHSVTSTSNECQAPYHTSYTYLPNHASCTYQVNKPQPRPTNPLPPKANQNTKPKPRGTKKIHACSEKTHPTLSFKP